MEIANFDTSTGGGVQAFAFGLAASSDEFPIADGLSRALNVSYWSGFGDGGTQNRVYFGRSHDYNNATIAYANMVLTNSNYKYIGQLVFTRTSSMKIKFVFTQLADHNVWRIDYTVLDGSAWESQATALFVSKDYVENVMTNGKCYIVAYGWSGSDSVANPYGKVTVEEGYTVTEKDDYTLTTRIPVGGTYTLPEMSNTSEKVFIGWKSSADNKLYVAGTKMDVTANVTFTATYVDFAQTGGAAIRKTSSYGETGVRFQAILNESSYNSVSSYIKKLGIIIMPDDLIGDKDFTMANYPSTSTGGVVYSEKNKAEFEFEDGEMDFRLSLINIREKNYNRPLAGRAYLVVTANGQDTYVYTDYDYTVSARSVVDVATAALKNSESDPNGVLTGFIDRSLNLTYSGGTNGTFAIADKLDRASSSRIAKSVSGSISSTKENYGTVTDIVTTIRVTVDLDRFNNELGGSFKNVTVNGKILSGLTQSVSGNVVTITATKGASPIYERDADPYNSPFFALKSYAFVTKWNRIEDGTLVERPKADNELLYDLNFATGGITTVFKFATRDPDTDEIIEPERGFTGVDGMDYNGDAALDINSFWESSQIPYGHQWLICQWQCYYQFGLYVEGSDATVTRNGSIIRQEDGGKYVEVDVSKVGNITLGISAAAENEKGYGSSSYSRTGDDPWLHLLLQSSVEEQLNSTEYDKLYLEADFTVTKCDRNTASDYNPSLHTAQFQWYISLYGPSEDDPTELKPMIWIGLQFFDYNNLGATAPKYSALDTGGTNMWIYNPNLNDCAKVAGNIVSNDHLAVIGQRNHVKVDILPYIQEALDLLHAQGMYSWVTDVSEFYIWNHNIGWEVPGNFDCEAQLYYLNMYYE